MSCIGFKRLSGLEPFLLQWNDDMMDYDIDE